MNSVIRGFFCLGIFTGLFTSFLIIPMAISMNQLLEAWEAIGVCSLLLLIFGVLFLFEKKSPEGFKRKRR